MNNKNFLRERGYNILGDDVVDNVLIKTKLPLMDYVVFNNERINSTDNFNKLYNYHNWSKLPLKDKLSLLNWSMKKFLKENGVKKVPEISFFDKYMEKYNGHAYIRENKIVIDLEYFNSANGYECLFTILHESQHFADAVDKLYTMADVEKYIDGEATFTKIMELPISGKIFNYETNSYEEITKDESDRILKLKNSFIGSSIYHRHISDISTREGFDKYIDNLFYICCPLEISANFAAYECVEDIYESNNKGTYEDELVMFKKEKTINLIISKISEMKEIYDTESLKDAQNMELVSRFNKLEFQNNNKNYICKDLMTKRENVLEKAYKAKNTIRE